MLNSCWESGQMSAVRRRRSEPIGLWMYKKHRTQSMYTCYSQILIQNICSHQTYSSQTKRESKAPAYSSTSGRSFFYYYCIHSCSCCGIFVKLTQPFSHVCGVKGAEKDHTRCNGYRVQQNMACVMCKHWSVFLSSTAAVKGAFRARCQLHIWSKSEWVLVFSQERIKGMCLGHSFLV